MTDTAWPAAAAAPRVMLITWWATADGAWTARLVGPEGELRNFCSPFELARYLSTPPTRPTLSPVPGSSAITGLR
jgi:hypothetical protein